MVDGRDAACFVALARSLVPADGCQGPGGGVPGVAQPNRQARRARAKEMAARAAHCRRVAIRRGRRWCCPLVDVLAEYGAIGASLPYPSQQTLARELGVDERTVRRWLAELEGLGLVVVYRTEPERDRETGKWRRRQTNRYLLADVKARASAPSCPLPRRRLGASALVSPTGHPCPVTASQGSTSGGAAIGSASPPPREEVEPVGMIEWSSPSAPAPIGVELAGPQDSDQGKPSGLDQWQPPSEAERAAVAAIRAGIRSVLPHRRRF